MSFPDKLHLSFASDNLAVPEIHTAPSAQSTEESDGDAAVRYDVAVPEYRPSKSGKKKSEQ